MRRSALQRLQRSFAVACKTAIQPRMTANITDAYLGPTVAPRYLGAEGRVADAAAVTATIADGPLPMIVAPFTG